MSWERTFKEELESFNSFLKAYVENYFSSTFHELKKGIEYSLFPGGKRFRPLLVFGGLEHFDNNINRAMAFATAVEFIHTYSLIHDDLPSMDNADYRRGEPATHKVFGEGMAVLIGDALLTEAFAIFGRDELWEGVAPTLRIRLIKVLGESAGALGMVGGQSMDILYKERKTDIEDIIYKKTARLISAAYAGGAIIGGASKKKVLQIEEIGRKIGIAFQIIDDIKDAGKSDTGASFVKEKGMDEAVSRAETLLKEVEKEVEKMKGRIIKNIIKYMKETLKNEHSG